MKTLEIMREELKPLQKEAQERAKRILRKISSPSFPAVRQEK